MADYRTFLSNCLMGGVDWTPSPKGGEVRNLIRVTLDGYDIALYQHPDVIASTWLKELPGHFVQSTEVVVRDVKPEDETRVHGMIVDLSDLLSFATLSPVAFYAYQYPSKTGQAHQFAVIGNAQYTRPTLQIRHGATIK